MNPHLGERRSDGCVRCAELERHLEAALIAAQTATDRAVALQIELDERRERVAAAMPSLRNDYGPRFGDLR